MNREELRAQQAPLKDKYKQQPATALVTLRAEGNLAQGVACSVDVGKAFIEAGLHPATACTRQRAAPGCRYVLATCCYRRWLPVPG